MGLMLEPRVKETSVTTGTGSMSLLGAIAGFRTFAAAIGNANKCYYTIEDSSGNWEDGVGTISTGPDTLTRTTVLDSSNAGALVSWPAGTKLVYVTPHKGLFPIKGADVASASNLAIGHHAKYYNVTGTTTINTIDARPAGDEIELKFAGASTVAHDAAKIILQGGVNFTPAAGDVMRLRSEDGTIWRETNRHTAAAVVSGSVTATAGEALSANDLVYQDIYGQRDANNRWWKVDTDAVAPVKIGPRIGFALTAAAGAASTFTCQISAGNVSGFSGLTANAPVWASTTAGGITQTAPAIPATGTQIATRFIGVASSTTAIDFLPHDATVFTKRDSALASGSALTVEHFPDAGGRERQVSSYLVASTTQALIDRTAGTALGDMTDNLGLAGAFDGTTSATAGGGAGHNASSISYIGKDWGSGVTKTVTGFRAYSSSDLGFESGGGNITVTLQGSTDNFSASIVDLGSVGPTADANSLILDKFSGITTTTAYRYHRLKIETTTSGNNMYCTEAQFYEDVASYDEALPLHSESMFSAATDKVTARFADASNANADTKTTFRNRTNATRDLAVEVLL